MDDVGSGRRRGVSASVVISLLALLLSAGTTAIGALRVQQEAAKLHREEVRNLILKAIDEDARDEGNDTRTGQSINVMLSAIGGLLDRRDVPLSFAEEQAIGDLASLWGSVEQAEKHYLRAIRQAQTLGEKGESFARLGDAFFLASARRSTSKARTYYEQALAAFLKDDTDPSRYKSVFASLNLARLEIAEGGSGATDAGIRRAHEAFAAIREQGWKRQASTDACDRDGDETLPAAAFAPFDCAPDTTSGAPAVEQKAPLSEN